MEQKVNIKKLMTVRNFGIWFAKKLDRDKPYVTGAIYKMIREKKIEAIKIDGVTFINTAKLPS